MIYVIRVSYYNFETGCPDNLLKIGYCRDDRKDVRLASYRTENPRVQPLFFIEEGTEEHERRLHYKFKEFLEEGREWFKESEKILNFFKNATLEDLDNLNPIPKKERKFPRIFYSELIPEDSPEFIKDFYYEYDQLTTYVDKIQCIVDYLIQYPERKEIIINNLVDSDKIKQQLVTLGPERIKSLGYNITQMKKAMGITIFDKSQFLEEVYDYFLPGQRYTKKYIKEKLGELYKKMDYKGTPKATDLEEWMIIKRCKITVDSKREEGFEIISKK